MNFKSKQSYLNWIKYGKQNGLMRCRDGGQRITIAGRRYTVKHKYDGREL